MPDLAQRQRQTESGMRGENKREKTEKKKHRSGALTLAALHDQQWKIFLVSWF